MLIFLYFLIGAIAGRIRGAGNITFEGTAGTVVIPDWVARFIVWGLPVGVLVGVYSQNIVYALVAQILAGVGVSFGYFGKFGIDDAENQNWKNYALLSLSGLIRFTPILVAAAFIGHWNQVIPAVVAGFAFVPAYKLGIVLRNVKLPLLTSYTEWGEFLFWGVIYSALGAGMMIG